MYFRNTFVADRTVFIHSSPTFSLRPSRQCGTNTATHPPALAAVRELRTRGVSHSRVELNTLNIGINQVSLFTECAHRFYTRVTS